MQGKMPRKKNHANGREKKKQTPAEGNAPKNAKLPVISHLVEINFLMKYLGKNAVNSIFKPRNFEMFRRNMPPDLPTG